MGRKRDEKKEKNKMRMWFSGRVICGIAHTTEMLQ